MASSFAYTGPGGELANAGGFVSLLVANNTFEQSTTSAFATLSLSGEIAGVFAGNSFSGSATMLDCTLPGINGTLIPQNAPTLVQFLGNSNQVSGKQSLAGTACYTTCDPSNTNVCKALGIKVCGLMVARVCVQAARIVNLTQSMFTIHRATPHSKTIAPLHSQSQLYC
jgi:hypothetical protein